MAMVPVPASQTVTSVTMNGSSIPFAMVTVKGIQYARFPAANGAYAGHVCSEVIPPCGQRGHSSKWRIRCQHGDKRHRHLQRGN